MQNENLPNSAISASSQLNSYYGPENARLHFHPQSGRNGAWIPNKQDHAQWLQVDFGVETVITRVETQGRQDAAQWVKEYTLRYSTDGNYFRQYQVNGYTKVSHLLYLQRKITLSCWNGRRATSSRAFKIIEQRSECLLQTIHSN